MLLGKELSRCPGRFCAGPWVSGTGDSGCGTVPGMPVLGVLCCAPCCAGGVVVETSTPYLQRGVPGVWEYEERCPSEEAGLQSPGM